MQKSLLIKLMKSLNEDELRRFEEFLNSPFYNKSRKVIELYKYLKKFRPDYTDAALEKEKVFRALYKGKKYNNSVLNNLIHELNFLGDKFLEISNYERNKMDNLIYRID